MGVLALGLAVYVTNNQFNLSSNAKSDLPPQCSYILTAKRNCHLTCNRSYTGRNNKSNRENCHKNCNEKAWKDLSACLQRNP